MDKRSVQASGPTVEEAIQRGLAELGVRREQVEIQVIEEGRRGILGIGTREAIVRLEVIVPMDELVAQHVVSEPEQVQGSLPASETSTGGTEGRMSAEQIAQVAQQTLSELLDKMGVKARVVARLDPEVTQGEVPVVLDVQGDGLDVLIGHRGKVLNALQYITRLIVSREVECWVDLVVDVEMYKQRRASSLHKLAQRMAERVAKTQQPVALEPMPPNERREIHLALRDHPDVTTQSVGRGDNRRVTIIPRR